MKIMCFGLKKCNNLSIFYIYNYYIVCQNTVYDLEIQFPIRFFNEQVYRKPIKSGDANSEIIL